MTELVVAERLSAHPRFDKENAMSNLTIIDEHDDAICGDDSNQVCAECVGYEGSLDD